MLAETKIPHCFLRPQTKKWLTENKEYKLKTQKWPFLANFQNRCPRGAGMILALKTGAKYDKIGSYTSFSIWMLCMGFN